MRGWSQADTLVPCYVFNSIKNNHDLAFSNHSLLPYGNGDGGGGPQRAMLERLRRMKDTDGLPQCKMGGAETFFESVVESAHDLQEWKGELVNSTTRSCGPQSPKAL